MIICGVASYSDWLFLFNNNDDVCGSASFYFYLIITMMSAEARHIFLIGYLYITHYKTF